MTAETPDRLLATQLGDGSRRGKQFVVLIVTATALLQALWISVVPPFRGSDEFDHAYRAAAVAGGQWRATQAPEDGRGLLVVAPKALVEAAHEQCASLSYTGPDNCSPAKDLGEGRVLVASGAANYNPVYYWVVGTIAAPFSGAAMLYAMRVASALLCLLFIALAAWSISVRRAPTWSGAGVLVAITPVMLYSTAITAPNGLEMAAALALWASLLGVAGPLRVGDSAPVRTERRLIAIAIVAGMTLATLRMLGPFFIVCIVLTVSAFRPAIIGRLFVVHTRLFAGGFLLVLGSVAAATYWILSTGSMNAGPDPQGGEWRASRLVLWPLQMIAAFPYRDQPGPLVVYPVVVLAFGGLVIAGLMRGSRRDRTVLLLMMAVALGIPILITLLTYSGRGAMWQGRYGLPYALGIVLVASSVLDRALAVSRWRKGLTVLGGFAFAAVAAASLRKVLNSELARPASAGDPGWHPPAAVLVAAVAMLAVAMQTWSVVRSQREPA